MAGPRSHGRKLIALGLAVFAVLVAAAVTRSTTSRERAVFAGIVEDFRQVPDNSYRTVPLPGDIVVKLADGRTLEVPLETDVILKPGTPVEISEQVAPWGEVWYRVKSAGQAVPQH